MKQLFVIKEKIKQFVGKNEVFILPVLKFLLTFIALSRINSQIGFMSRLSNSAITLIVALAGSFLPMNLTLVILAVITTTHVYALSFECCILVLAIFLILFLLYFRFSSKDSVAALLVPLAFVFKIPYVMPVAMGLIGTPSSIVSVGCGVVVYFVLHYINVSVDSFSGSEAGGISIEIGAFKNVVDGLFSDKTMIVYIVAFCTTVLIVYVIRRLSINYSWAIAIAAGTLADFFIILIANSALNGNVSLGGAFLGTIISIILNVILQYFCFDLDYNRVERVQFEDDEYYYYVKAVPKNTVKLSDNGKRKTNKKPTASKPSAVKALSSHPKAKRPASGASEAFSPIRRTANTRENSDTASRARETVRNKAASAAMRNGINRNPREDRK